MNSEAVTMNITLRQCEIVLAAAETTTFSAAAKSLGISQPSLSESIRRIEREIGAQLFERTTRSLKLTAEGRHAAAVARDAVRDFRHALERLASGARAQGPIAIAALPSITCAALPAAITNFRKDYPETSIALHDVQHERALALVADGVADIAVTIKPAKQSELVFDE